MSYLIGVSGLVSLLVGLAGSAKVRNNESSPLNKPIGLAIALGIVLIGLWTGLRFQ